MKVTSRAGNVGATCADVISYRGIASEVVLLDIKKDLLKVRRWILCNVLPIQVLTQKYRVLPMIIQKTANSSVVVITSGIPRKPGMTREELIESMREL
jgi:malate dehydrogenase